MRLILYGPAVGAVVVVLAVHVAAAIHHPGVVTRRGEVGIGRKRSGGGYMTPMRMLSVPAATRTQGSVRWKVGSVRGSIMVMKALLKGKGLCAAMAPFASLSSLVAVVSTTHQRRLSNHEVSDGGMRRVRRGVPIDWM